MESSNPSYQNVDFRKFFLTVPWLCIFFLIANNLSATTYYVATTGDDSNSGTSELLAWQTIAKAASTAQAGDKVYIKAGNYGIEHIIFPNDGTSNAPIRFIGYQTTPGDNPDLGYSLGDNLDSSVMPLLDGGNRATGGTALRLDYRDYVIVQNIQIKNYNTAVVGQVATNCTVENVIAMDLGDTSDSYDGTGILLSWSACNNLIKRCIVVNACAEGITINGSNGTVEYNTIEDCQVYSDGNNTVNASMDYYITIRSASHNTIIGCYIERGAGEPHNGHGIQLKGDCEYNLIKDCVAVNSSENLSVRHQGVKYNIFENCTAIDGGLCVRDGSSYNTFKNCRTIDAGYGVVFYDSVEDEEGCSSAGEYNKFINCIFENSTNCINLNSWSGYLTHGADNNDFINCIFNGGSYLFICSRESSDNTLKNCIITDVDNLETGTYTPAGFTSTYCDFYSNGFAMPAGTGNFSSDPLFVDATSGDYRLSAASPCIDAGTAVYSYDYTVTPPTSTVALDFDYNYLVRPYNSIYDVGAHEYTAENPLVYFKLDENTGTVTADDMDIISDGTINGASWTTGMANSALDFDGTDDNVSFGNPSILELPGSRTISGWIKPDANGSYYTIAGKYLWGYSLFAHNGFLRACVAGSTTSASACSNAVIITPGVWQHTAMTFDIDGDKKIHLYLNGEEIAYSSQTAMVGTPVNSSTYAFTIGSDYITRYYFNGLIDEVKVFERALSAQDILAESATVLSVDFDKGTGTTVVDASIYQNNGAVTNTAVTQGVNRVEGISGKALKLDGLDDYVGFGNPAALELNGSRSISAWIKPNKNSQYSLIISKALWGYSFFTHNGFLRAYIAGSTSAASAYSASAVITPGVWQHVAMTFDVDGDKKIHLYVNGSEVSYCSQVAMVGTPASTSANTFMIGCDFNGLIDEVKVYDKALSANQVNSIYQAY